MDKVDIDMMEEEMPVDARIRECIKIWAEHGTDDAPETLIDWDDLCNVVTADLKTLRRWRASVTGKYINHEHQQ